MNEFSLSKPEKPDNEAEGEVVAGFNRPRPPKDGYTARMYQELELGEAPSLEQIEPHAKALLESPATILEGMGLVLGRHVGTKELLADPDKGEAIMFASVEDKFAILLFQRDMEDRLAENSAEQGE